MISKGESRARVFRPARARLQGSSPSLYQSNSIWISIALCLSIIGPNTRPSIFLVILRNHTHHAFARLYQTPCICWLSRYVFGRGWERSSCSYICSPSPRWCNDGAGSVSFCRNFQILRFDQDQSNKRFYTRYEKSANICCWCPSPTIHRGGVNTGKSPIVSWFMKWKLCIEKPPNLIVLKL